MLSSDWLMKVVFFYSNSLFLQLFRHCWCICLIITLHRDVCNKIYKTLSVVRFIAKSYLPFLPFTETLVTKFVKHYQLCAFYVTSFGRIKQIHHVRSWKRQTKGQWFSAGTPVSSTNKTDRHDITEILLKVALNTIKQIKPKKNR